MDIFSSAPGMLLLLAIGALLLCTSLAAPILQRWPVSTAMIYLAAGVVAGPVALGWLSFDPVSDAGLLMVLAEVVVFVSLFVTGLKMDHRVKAARWWPSVGLASLTMVVTIVALTVLAYFLLGMPWGIAVLLAAILAPTDPVLASDIQVQDIEDRDALRFSLSGEAGLNDGTAFPFVMLGLGLAGEHELGAFGWRWLAYDVVWAVVAGLAVGAGVGMGVAKAIGWLHGARLHALKMNEFIAIGVIAVACAVAELVGGYAFLSVFVAGLALRRGLSLAAATPQAKDEPQNGTALPAPSPDSPRGQSARRDSERDAGAAAEEKVTTVLEFNGQLERIGEFVLVVIVGVALSQADWSWPLAAFTAIALLLVRPLAVLLTVPQSALGKRPRRLAAWFGIRGVGSVYYLAYAIDHGIGDSDAQSLASATLVVVAVSVVVHGLSVTPLMASHAARNRR